MAELNLGTLYDFNKQLMKDEPPLDPIQFANKINEVVNTLHSCKYIMLLCHERRDYTLFNLNKYDWTIEALKEDISEVLSNRGIILAIDYQGTGAYEIWIKDNASEECFAYYLFDYSMGVIEVGENLKNE